MYSPIVYTGVNTTQVKKKNIFVILEGGSPFPVSSTSFLDNHDSDFCTYGFILPIFELRIKWKHPIFMSDLDST